MNRNYPTEALNFASEIEGNGKMFAWGTTVPTDGTAGYGPGCIFIDQNAAAGSQMFINEGSVTSCDFNAVVSISCAATLTNKTLTSPTLAGSITDTSTKTITGSQTVSRGATLVEADYNPANRVYYRSDFHGRIYSIAVASDWSNFKSIASANLDWIFSRSATAATARASSDGACILSDSNSSALCFIRPRVGSRLNKVKWNSSRSPRFRCVIKTGASIADERWMIGLESVARPKYLRNSAPDSNRVEVYFHQNADSRIHARVGKGGSSSSAAMSIVPAADTVYDIDIRVSSSRIVTIYVNGTLLFTSTVALAANKSLIPIIGHQSEGAKRAMALYYTELSQDFG